MTQTKNEKSLQETLRTIGHIPPLKRLCWKLQDTYITGVPDQIYLVNRFVTWVELKYVPLEKISPRDGTFVPRIRPSQRLKLIEWAAAGGRSLLCVGVVDSFYVIPGALCPMARARVSAADLQRLAMHVYPLDRANLRSFVADVLGGPF